MPNAKKTLFLLAIIAIVIFLVYPVTAYTIESSGKQNYTAVSGARVNYSISSGTAAHNLTMEMILAKTDMPGPAVTGTRSPYSFRQGPAAPYSIKLPAKKAPALLGETIKETPANETPVEVPVNETPIVPGRKPADEIVWGEPMFFTIEGIVYDDADRNGLMDNNEIGLANWKINLEQPAGTVIDTATTDTTGKFTFADLAAGEYMVSEVLPMGWNLIAPADGGKIPVVITDESVTTLQFANNMVEYPVIRPNNQSQSS